MTPRRKPSPDLTPNELNILLKDYEQVITSFRQLADIRFKLLAFVPTVGGVATYALSQSTLNPTSSTTPARYDLALLGGIIGFLVTLGVVIYDQRNSQLYNVLFDRAKFLEGRLDFPHRTDPDRTGGQFHEKPKPDRRMLGLFLAKHDTGLALIYASVLGAWLYPIVLSIDTSHNPARAGASAAVVGLIFWIDLMRLDGAWRRLWRRLWP